MLTFLDSLALIELRLVISRMLFEFDYEIMNPEVDLVRDSKVLSVWNKVPVMLRLMPRKTGGMRNGSA